MMAQKGPVEFKGKLNGLYLNLDPNVDFEVIMAYLTTLLENRASFYKGSRIIGVRGKELNYKQKASVETLIYDQYGITVESLEDMSKIETITTPEKAVDKATDKSLEKSVDKTVDAISVKEEKPEAIATAKSVESIAAMDKKTISLNNNTGINNNTENDTHFVFGTMRSGKSVHYPGHVVVIGDVNPGAEIVAEGNIIVMGRVLGFIHAGSSGNDKSIVIANLLKPTQIRISKYISVPPSDDESHHTNVPEKATVCDGVIKIEKCH